ncbi:MAG: hypothetical protein HYW90_04675 [Candidatus Sungbacteria bacterium]|nr:hypothetical protein [Candidatus Sungbacteria bacterium]
MSNYETEPSDFMEIREMQERTWLDIQKLIKGLRGGEVVNTIREHDLRTLGMKVREILQIIRDEPADRRHGL